MKVYDHYFSFEGRISRKEYWIDYCLKLFLPAYIIGFIIDILLFGGMPVGTLLISISLMIPSLTCLVKRWHDHGRSGLWALIILIPIVGTIWNIIVVGFLRGTKGPNIYGDDPLT